MWRLAVGKKKGKKHDADHASEHAFGHGRTADEPRFEVPPQVAGLAAMMAKQAMTPAARQMIAGALHAAADAVARGAAAGAKSAAPVAPVPPGPPEASAAPEPSYQPGFTVPPFNLPPEAARVVDAAASVLEGWAQKLGKPKGPMG